MQRVVGVLLRPSCVSLSVSNQYQSLAEPLGALMLRGQGTDTKVPTQTLARMLRAVSTELDGCVWGAEHLCHNDVMLDKFDDERRAAARKVQRDIAGEGVEEHKAIWPLALLLCASTLAQSVFCVSCHCMASFCFLATSRG